MASQPETNSHMQSILERLISSRNRNISLFIPFLLGLSRPDSAQTESDPGHNSGDHSSPDGQNPTDRIILINPLTQGMVVIEGAGIDTLLPGVGDKDGTPPASKSSVEALPRVETREGEGEGDCVICFEELMEGVVKEMPCTHRFHGGCIERWLGLHGSCPICRFMMPFEGKKGEERREIWVSFSFGGGDNDVVNDGSNLSGNVDNQMSLGRDDDGGDS